MAAGTIDLPAVGKVKKQYVYYGGTAIAALLGYKYYQSTRGGDEPVLSGDGTDEFGNLLGMDPQQVSGASGSGLTDNTPTTSPFAFNNNAEWTQWVVDYMSQRGIDSDLMLAAVGDYLGRQPLAANEQGWIRGAIAAAGPPPQGGPFDIVKETPGTTPPPSVALGVPAPVVTSVQRTAVTFKWPAVPGATRYYVSRSGGGQTSHAAGDRSHTSRSLKPNTTYSFNIRAARGNRPAEIIGNVRTFTVKTKK